MADLAALRLAEALAPPRPWPSTATVSLSIREIAARARRSPGTVAAHLSKLAALGVTSGTRPFTIDLGRLDSLLQHPAPPAVAAPPAPSSVAAAAVRLVELAVSSPDLADRILSLAETLVGCPRDGRATAARSTRATVGWLESPTNQPTEPPGQRLENAESQREQTARAADGSRGDSREAASVAEVIAPLLAVCSELRLPVTYHEGSLVAALAAYDDAQVTAAVERLVCHVRADSNVKNPVGLLVHSARTKTGVFAPAPAAPPRRQVALLDDDVPRPLSPAVAGMRPGPGMVRAVLSPATGSSR